MILATFYLPIFAKFYISSAETCDQLKVFLPAAVLAKLPAKPDTTSPRLKFSNRQVEKFTKTAAFVQERPVLPSMTSIVPEGTRMSSSPDVAMLAAIFGHSETRATLDARLATRGAARGSVKTRWS